LFLNSFMFLFISLDFASSETEHGASQAQILT
jgi:hypothetical protein